MTAQTVFFQRNALPSLAGAWSDITSLTIANGQTLTLGVSETAAVARLGYLYVAGIANCQPGDVADRQGKEAITEGWLKCRAPLGSWVTLTFPTTFPVLLGDLGPSDGVYAFSVPASSRTLVEFSFTIPGDPEPTTAGEFRFMVELVLEDA
jgi:hypothetical protein